MNFRKNTSLSRLFFYPGLTLLVLFCSACGIETVLPPDYLVPPFNLSVYPGDGRITVRFESINNEQKFDGFNIYLADSSGVRTAGIDPLLNAGTAPTIPATRYETSSGAVITQTFIRDRQDQFVLNGVTYYLAVRSHNYSGYQSDFSAEVSTTPRPQSASPLSLANGGGFSLSPAGFSPPYDIVLSRVSNVSWFACPDGQIKDEGWYASPVLYNRVQDAGFLPAGTSVPLAEGHVYVIKRADNTFGKIFVRSVSESGVVFEWAYQPVAGNTDI